MNETIVTFCGNVALDPAHTTTPDGTPITTLRVASTIRRYDRGERGWVDGETTWMTVTCWRELAVNVAASIHKGDRVIIYGRLRFRRWTQGDRSGSSTDIQAYAVGHDLTYGTAEYARVRRRNRPEHPAQGVADDLARAVDEVFDEPPDDEGGGRREDGGREDGGREDGGREDGGREDGGREDGGREDGVREDGVREGGQLDPALTRSRPAGRQRQDGALA